MTDTQDQADPRIPSGLNSSRSAVLRAALRELGTHELTGHNDGAVEKYLPKWAHGRGLPWCAFFVGYVLEQALGKHPYGHRVGGAWDLYQLAKGLGEASTREVTPGEVGIILHDTDDNPDTRSAGHAVLVLRVSEDGSRVNCVEGNYRNRVGLTVRPVADFEAFLDFYGRATPTGGAGQWVRGLIEAPLAGGLAATR